MRKFSVKLTKVIEITEEDLLLEANHFLGIPKTRFEEADDKDSFAMEIATTMAKEYLDEDIVLGELDASEFDSEVEIIASKFIHMAKEKKVEGLKSALSAIEKDYGEGVYSYANTEKGSLQVIPFSITSMNYISGIGGIPKGRISEFHGMEGTFKTTFTLDLIVQCQSSGGTCAFIDAEFSFSPEYAETLGVDLDRLLLFHPASAEEAFGIMEKLVESNEVDLIVLDSIAALSPSAELANEFGASNMGVMARLMGQMFRKLVMKVGKSNTALVFINQLREQLGGYVPMKTTPGGNALKFYASMRFEISKSLIKEGDDVKGVKLRVRCVKNKLAKPFLTTEVDAIYGEGIDKLRDMINMSIAYDIVKKGGAWLTYEGNKYQGFDAFKQLLLDNEDFYLTFQERVNGHYSGPHDSTEENVIVQEDLPL